jgi:hypothetical protein
MSAPSIHPPLRILQEMYIDCHSAAVMFDAGLIQHCGKCAVEACTVSSSKQLFRIGGAGILAGKLTGLYNIDGKAAVG